MADVNKQDNVFVKNRNYKSFDSRFLYLCTMQFTYPKKKKIKKVNHY